MSQNKLYFSGKIMKMEEDRSKNDLHLVDIHIEQKTKKGEEIVKARAIGEMATKIFKAVEIDDYVFAVGKLQSFEYKKDDGSIIYIMSIFLLELHKLSKSFYPVFDKKGDDNTNKRTKERSSRFIIRII